MNQYNFDKNFILSKYEKYLSHKKITNRKIIEKKIYIGYINKYLFGDIYDDIYFTRFNNITLIGQDKLVDKFLYQNPENNNINIFINTYIESKNPNNYYKIINDNMFVIMVITREKYEFYNKLYPYYIFCIQPDIPIKYESTLDYTCMILSYYLKLNSIIKIDNNIKIKNTELNKIINLIKNKKLTNFGIIHFKQNDNIHYKNFYFRGILILNCKLLYNKGIIFSPFMYIGHDHDFMIQLINNNLNNNFIDDIIYYKEIKNDNMRLLSDDNKQIINDNYVLEHLSHLLIQNGFIYSCNNKVMEVTGSVQIITKSEMEKISKNFDNKYDYDKYILKLHPEKCQDYCYCLRNNFFNLKIKNSTLETRLNLSKNYIQCEINDIINNYDLAKIKNNILKPIQCDINLSREFYYIGYKQLLIFRQIVKNKIFINIINDFINDIKFENKFLVIDDLLFYINNYKHNPTYFNKLCIIINLYTKCDKIIKIISKSIKYIDFYHILTIFGNINSYQKIYQEYINNIIKNILISTTVVNNEYIIDNNIVNKSINLLFDKLIK